MRSLLLPIYHCLSHSYQRHCPLSPFHRYYLLNTLRATLQQRSVDDGVSIVRECRGRCALRDLGDYLVEQRVLVPVEIHDDVGAFNLYIVRVCERAG